MIYCIQHRFYRGKTTPRIECKVCCHIFIEEIKHCRIKGLPFPRFINSSRYKNTSNSPEQELKAPTLATNA